MADAVEIDMEQLTTVSHVMDMGFTNGQNSNVDNSTAPKSPPHVADAAFDKDIRIIALYVEVTLGAIGGAGVLLWLWHNWRRKSRVNLLILHVAISDLLVIFAACLPQLIWEHMDRRWNAGQFVCKMLKFMQSFSMMASNNMLVVLSIDRMLAIRWPLRTPIPVSTCQIINIDLSIYINVLVTTEVNIIQHRTSTLQNSNKNLLDIGNVNVMNRNENGQTDSLCICIYQ